MLNMRLICNLFLSALGVILWVDSQGQSGCSAIQVERSMLESESQHLGKIKAGAHSFTNRCTRPQVIQDLQAEACKLGADVFVITEEKAPGLWRSCFTIEAAAYRSPTARVNSLAFADLKELAASGNTEAQHALGSRFVNGDGIENDLIEAYAWFNVAASQNISKSVEERDRLEARLSPQDLAEAQDRSVEIWLKYYRIGAHRGVQP